MAKEIGQRNKIFVAILFSFPIFFLLYSLSIHWDCAKYEWMH